MYDSTNPNTRTTGGGDVSEKETVNKYTLPVLSFLFGTIAIRFTGQWRYCLFYIVSFLPWGQEFIFNIKKAKDGEKITALLEASGLTKKLGDNILKPYEIWRQETETGYRAGLSLPKGLSSEDFKKREQAVGESLGAKVEFSYEKKGQVMMEVSTVQLNTMYEFKPVEFENPATMPAGHSKTGFQAIAFGDGISSLLVGAQSRAGKSSFLRQIVANTIITTDPRVIRLHLGDLKFGAEFGIFSDCQHVQSYAERINEIADMVGWLRYEAERRFKLFKRTGVFKVSSYNEVMEGENKKGKDDAALLPFHFLIIDEVASLVKEKDILHEMVELSRLSGAAGIYCIFSTQNPTVDVVPSHLKANCQARMAFRVSSGVNSMVILDRYGAEEINCQGRAILRTDDFYEVQVSFLDERECKRLIEPFKTRRKGGIDTSQGHDGKQEPKKQPAIALPKGVISLADWTRFKNS